MSEALIYFVLGTSVSIPIAVLAPIATPRVQQRWAQRNRRINEQRRRSLSRSIEQARRYHQDPALFTTYLMGRILLITLATAFAALMPALFSAIGEGLYVVSSPIASDGLVDALFTAGSLASVVGSVVVITLCQRSLRLWRTVVHFEDFEDYVNLQLAGLPQLGEPAESS